MTTPDQIPTEPTDSLVIVGPDGQPVAGIPIDTDGDGAPDALASMPAEGIDGSELTDLVSQPAKVMRIGSMIKQLLDEVRSAPLDEASRASLREIHRRSIAELEDGLAPELVDELERLTLPFTDDSIPSEAELRIAQAQLVGWLEGLFHGIQTALFAQQMAARAQFEEMRRRALPMGSGDLAQGDGSDERRISGPYL
jgi:hypothetical protein